LLPAATEVLAALGCADRLDAVTFECDFPEGIRANRMIAVNTPMPSGLTPSEIDAFVRARMAAGLPMYELDGAVIQSIQPSVIVTQDLCRVCALPADQVNEAIAVIGCDSHVIDYDPHTIEDVFAGIETIASAVGANQQGTALVSSLRGRVKAVSQVASGITPATVLVLEWTDPPFVAGHWVPELVSLAGGNPVLSMPGERSTTVSWDEAISVRPDFVFVAACGFDLDGARNQALTIADRFPNASIWAVDGNAYVTRPGPRLVDAIEAFAEVLRNGQATAGITAAVRPPIGRS
jgi:iron complex transport system substrate-binding protein